MTSLPVFALAGVALFSLGLRAILTRAHLFWKVLGINVMANGTFLVFVSGPARAPGADADPVPQAMVLTGIVVAVSATALALGLALRVVLLTGRPYLETPEEP